MVIQSFIPEIKNEQFIYNCSNKFIIDFVQDYIKQLDGSIIFVNGNEAIIYSWKSRFVKQKHINANLIKRHRKGGQSSVRFARLAEESRTHYVTYIIDNINTLKTKNNWIFGSNEILSMIIYIILPVKLSICNILYSLVQIFNLYS